MSGAKESGRQVYLCDSAKGWGYYRDYSGRPSLMLDELESSFPDLVYAFRDFAGNNERSDAVFFVEKKLVVAYGFRPDCLDEPGVIVKIKRKNEGRLFNNIIIDRCYSWFTKDFSKPRMILPNGPLVIVVNSSAAPLHTTRTIDDYVKLVDCCGADFLRIGKNNKPAGSDESEWLEELWYWRGN